MKNKQLKLLAKQSFTNQTLDKKRAELIVAKLKRRDARAYVRALKLYESQLMVDISLPFPADELLQKKLQLRFPDKKIVYTINKELLAGMRIVENDILYDYSFETKLNKLVTRVYETND